MRKIDKKGQVMQNLGALGIGIVTIAIIFSVMFIMVANVEDQIQDQDVSYEDTQIAGCNSTDNLNCSAAYNATVTLRAAAEDVPTWIPLVVIVALGGIILGLISAFKR